MDIVNNLLYAFSMAAEPTNLLSCFIGVLVGTMVGVLPGIGPIAAMSLLLPITFNLTPAQSIIMLAGIYYGAYYGGSTTSILVNIPGEVASVVTCLDGYQMARKGRAGPALGISAIGSFIGGTFCIIMLMVLAPPLADIALKFGTTETSAIIFFGLTMVTYLCRGSMVKALMMTALGLLIGCIGTDLISGSVRFTLGIVKFEDGIGLIPVCMGLFGVAEVFKNLGQVLKRTDIYKGKIEHILPTKDDWKSSIGPISRGSILGFILGLLPGGGGVIASFMSYTIEKKISKKPELFGTGHIAGVAGPETANNAGAGSAFIPLLTLGIPCNAILAILLGALIIHGVTPGPLFIKKHPDVFWGVVGSMYIGNGMLLLLNLPLIGLWVRILKVPYRYLFPLILLFCLVGSYSLNNDPIDTIVMLAFGIIGYIMHKFEYEAAPLILAAVLGPMFEENVNQSLILSGGDPIIFFTRPISAVIITISLLLIVSPILLKELRDKSVRIDSDD